LESWASRKGDVSSHNTRLAIRRTIRFKLLIRRQHMKAFSELKPIDVILIGT
jgi:hypothetical protein